MEVDGEAVAVSSCEGGRPERERRTARLRRPWMRRGCLCTTARCSGSTSLSHANQRRSKDLGPPGSHSIRHSSCPKRVAAKSCSMALEHTRPAMANALRLALFPHEPLRINNGCSIHSLSEAPSLSTPDVSISFSQWRFDYMGDARISPCKVSAVGGWLHLAIPHSASLAVGPRTPPVDPRPLASVVGDKV